jgi:1-aminocyclopropane-1-carboxylate deaminase/D-cysteine desulfhydrase-like pyridoxal-dependent ACC family enzyme
MLTNQSAFLERRLASLPRVPLVLGETPLHELPGLSRKLNRRVFVKRDDLTGLAFGGNKVRQAEFFIGEAIAAGADTIVAGGSFAQSNHARVLAGAARAAGLDVVILIRPGSGPASAPETGNALVTRLLATEVRFVDALADAPAEDRRAEIEFRRHVFEDEADRLRARGRRPYVVLGSSTATGVMGYVAAAAELHRQRQRLGLTFSHVFVTSLGATHAGLELGARLLGEEHSVVGVAYQPASPHEAEATVLALAESGADALGLAGECAITAVCTDVLEAGPGYGETTASSRAALRLGAASDALLLDPTYTAKGFAALLRWVAEGRVSEGESVLFVHTGGMPGLFARAAEGLFAS